MEGQLGFEMDRVYRDQVPNSEATESWRMEINGDFYYYSQRVTAGSLRAFWKDKFNMLTTSMQTSGQNLQ